MASQNLRRMLTCQLVEKGLSTYMSDSNSRMSSEFSSELSSTMSSASLLPGNSESSVKDLKTASENAPIR